jgi:WD40 repeat protein
LTLTFQRDHHSLFSHYGYIYAMALVRGLLESSPSEELLLTGSGDGVVKLWRLHAESVGTPVQWAKLDNRSNPVLSVDIEGPLLYCGLENGSLNVWNLESRQLVKQISSHSGELWTINTFPGFTLTGDSNGIVKVSIHPFLCIPHPSPFCFLELHFLSYGPQSETLTAATAEIQLGFRGGVLLDCTSGHHVGIVIAGLPRPPDICHWRKRRHCRHLESLRGSRDQLPYVLN